MLKRGFAALVVALLALPAGARADKTSDDMIAAIKGILPHACEAKKAQADKFKAMDDVQRASATGQGAYEQITTIKDRLADAQRREEQANLAAKPYGEKLTALTKGQRATPEQEAAVRPWFTRMQTNPCGK
ncbi:hypothetical protein [Azospirillum sp. TSO22-1]|uniref:hypothetical protein n=1 Tax=Azospirillum sp. TSO22-1 TaxID=716789 RepID=UPI000D61EABE|nr:hypothetical protein [Azospirillum sp. TSO22-1]PWC42122.1 hypothetical protein TSO221_22305 [Azospirillum sp. TSO22-1]